MLCDARHVSFQVLGKPAMADMSLGLATAPILYAAENAPEIKKIVKRRFKKEVRNWSL